MRVYFSATAKLISTIDLREGFRVSRYISPPPYNGDQSQRIRLNVVAHFCYAYINTKGSMIDRRGASKDAESRVAKAWSKWRELTGVICDKKVPTKMKLLIYLTVIRTDVALRL